MIDTGIYLILLVPIFFSSWTKVRLHMYVTFSYVAAPHFFSIRLAQTFVVLTSCKHFFSMFFHSIFIRTSFLWMTLISLSWRSLYVYIHTLYIRIKRWRNNKNMYGKIWMLLLFLRISTHTHLPIYVDVYTYYIYMHIRIYVRMNVHIRILHT